MSKRVIIVGAGMGGLTAAIRLRQFGYQVLVLEARKTAGGLASGYQIGDFVFDAGPYILLDRPGLEWIFDTLQIELPTLFPLDPVYEMVFSDGSVLRFVRDLDQTADGLEAGWPGSGRAYKQFVGSMQRVHGTLRPLLYRERPGLFDVFRSGIWKHIPFLSRPLQSVLAATTLPQPVQDCISIWTHIAGQNSATAPSPMALVPALIHSEGAFYPESGIRSIPEVLVAAAQAAGVQVRCGTRVKKIACENRRVTGVIIEDGELLPCIAVVSNAHGLSTYLKLVSDIPHAVRQRLSRLPLQSPGVCVYLAVRQREAAPYLRFLRLEHDYRLFVQPGRFIQEEWSPARIIAPMDHQRAHELGTEGQRTFAEQLLSEEWWRSSLEYRVLEVRTPEQWGVDYNLYEDSMNAVMTAQSLRLGRLAHRSPWIRGLYLAGSSTNPGQWVSFCGISGILAADCLRKDDD